LEALVPVRDKCANDLDSAPKIVILDIVKMLTSSVGGGGGGSSSSSSSSNSSSSSGIWDLLGADFLYVTTGGNNL